MRCSNHSLTITASASCVNGVATISYMATSWDQSSDNGGVNPDIGIFFNNLTGTGTPNATGFFTTSQPVPLNQFSGQAPAPTAAVTVDVVGVALAAWGDGYPGYPTTPLSNVVPVTVPANCAQPRADDSPAVEKMFKLAVSLLLRVWKSTVTCRTRIIIWRSIGVATSSTQKT
jgi:hypothetical protein